MNVLPRSTVALALSALGLAAARPGRVCVITGGSMYPTLHHGQVVWVRTVDARREALHRGEVVVFRWRDRTYVKRVYATAGERVLLLADVGDSQPLLTPIRPDAEAFVMQAVRRRGHYRLLRLRVPPGTFFALGDCITDSIDSRSLGPIPVRAVLGRVRPLVGRLPDLDVAIGPLRPQHGHLRRRRSAEDTPPTRRRVPGRPPR
jgi:signal peptidase I